MDIVTVVDHMRGCGLRKPGGLYLMGGADFLSCGKMPIVLDVCKYCNAGIHITRSLQKINLKMLTETVECSRATCFGGCITDITEWAWLMSVGEKFYPGIGSFVSEAVDYGISKRIHAIPRGFKVGESVVALAHKKGYAALEPRAPIVVNDSDPESMFYRTEESVALPPVTVWKPAVFMLFKPNRIEYVTKGDETEEFLNGLAVRGITPVKVEYETKMKIASNEEGMEGDVDD